MGPPRILIVDDQPDVLASLRLLLKPEGYRVSAAEGPGTALEALRGDRFDAALIDLNYTRDTTSGAEGLELLGDLVAADPSMPVVVMTAWGSVDLAVEAMRRGARDFVQKPWENERLLATVRTQVELGRALRRGRRLEEENRLLRESSSAPTLIARSEAMRPVLDLVERIGPSDANVLITGEHGTGKDVVARALHAVSGRSDRPLLTVDVGAMAETVFSSEMFGHVAGAFTDATGDRLGRFEAADGGTLFLDEIANIPLSQQAKLLRVLETGEMERVGSSRTRRVDVRVLAATNADLDEAVREGRFREDLLFRLNTVQIHLPPLRERPEDVPVLAMHFLGRYRERYGTTITGFQPAALHALERHRWPGNVRELDHAVERAVLLGRGETIGPDDLGLVRRAGSDTVAGLEGLSLEEAERMLVARALERCDGNVSRAADELGLSRGSLYRRLEKHGLDGDLDRRREP